VWLLAGSGALGLVHSTNAESRSAWLQRLLGSYWLLKFAHEVYTKAKAVAPEHPKEIFNYYLFIWQVFYRCYLALPLMQ
jgi:hypothetical protein